LSGYILHQQPSEDTLSIAPMDSLDCKDYKISHWIGAS